MYLTHPDVRVNAPLAEMRTVARRNFVLAPAAIATGASVPRNIAVAEEKMGELRSAHIASDDDRAYMVMALKLMRQAGVIDKTGGPFGAVVVLNGEILAAASNSVLRDNDPSAHAEVNAMRAACRKLGNPHIEGAVLYSSCEPCPMCYATAYWARVGKIFYAASWADYADLFDDSNIAKDMQFPYEKRQVTLQQIMRTDAQQVWDEFRKLPDGARY